MQHHLCWIFNFQRFYCSRTSKPYNNHVSGQGSRWKEKKSKSPAVYQTRSIEWLSSSDHTSFFQIPIHPKITLVIFPGLEYISSGDIRFYIAQPALVLALSWSSRSKRVDVPKSWQILLETLCLSRTRMRQSFERVFTAIDPIWVARLRRPRKTVSWISFSSGQGILWSPTLVITSQEYIMRSHSHTSPFLLFLADTQSWTLGYESHFRFFLDLAEVVWYKHCQMLTVPLLWTFSGTLQSPIVHLLLYFAFPQQQVCRSAQSAVEGQWTW